MIYSLVDGNIETLPLVVFNSNPCKEKISSKNLNISRVSLINLSRKHEHRVKFLNMKNVIALL